MKFSSEKQRRKVMSMMNSSRGSRSVNNHTSGVRSERNSESKMILEKKKKPFPDSITWGVFERFYDSKAKEFDDMKKRDEYQKKTGGQIYTLVDGDNDTIWSKGRRVVNSVDRWVVLVDPNREVDNS